jgi:hydrogenase expression/formation protein HypD
VRIVYSPLDAVKLAEQNPTKEVVFFGVGFETTAPATAMAVFQAAQKGLKNFSMLISHVLVPPAIAALMSSPLCRVQAFLAAGHVCTVMGYEEYPPLAAKVSRAHCGDGF